MASTRLTSGGSGKSPIAKYELRSPTPLSTVLGHSARSLAYSNIDAGWNEPRQSDPASVLRAVFLRARFSSPAASSAADVGLRDARVHGSGDVLSRARA